MYLKDLSLLYIFIGEIAIGVAIFHVGEEVVKVLDFINGADKDHYFGVFDESQIGNHEGNAFFLCHEHILLLQILRNVDFLMMELLFCLFFLLDLLEANVLRVIHGKISQECLHLLVEVSRH